MKKLKYCLILLMIGCSESDDKPIASPTSAQLLYPTDKEVCWQGQNSQGTTSRVTFEWENAKDASRYDLHVINATTGEEEVVFPDIRNTQKELELPHDEPYEWYVISKNSNSPEFNESSHWFFFLVGEPQVNYAPFPSQLISPSHNSFVEDFTIDLSWEGTDSDRDSLTYTLFMDTIDGQQENVVVENISKTTYEVTLESSKTYYWRIKASDGKNNSLSTIKKFTVE